MRNCILNASGCWCKTIDELDDLYNSMAGGIISKTCSKNERIGNSPPRYYGDITGSVNSMGLPNKGYKYYTRLYTSFVKKPYVISVSGGNIEDTIIMLDHINTEAFHADNLIEVNVSCPNIIGKPQVAYQFDLLDNYLSRLADNSGNYSKLTLGLKLPPFFDPVHINEVFSIIQRYPFIKFLTCINSLGNGLIIDTENDAVTIHPKEGLGGIGGSYVKPIGLSNIWQFYQLIKKNNLDIKLIGCGGISCGWDVYEYLLCGADLVQVGTCLLHEGPTCFERIARELETIMFQTKKKMNLKEIRGTLKTLKPGELTGASIFSQTNIVKWVDDFNETYH